MNRRKKDTRGKWLGAGLGGVFPSLDDIKKAMGSVIKPVSDAIGKIPATLRAIGRKAVGPMVDAVTKSIDTVKTAVDSSLAFVKLVVVGYKRWNADRFRARLGSFFNDILALAEEPGRILLDLKIPLKADFINSILKDMPAIVLYPVAQGLDGIPGWDQMPGKLLAVSRKIPSLNESQQKVCETLLAQPQLHVTIKDARLLGRMLSKTLDLAISLLPRDLSVSASVLGEGAGTEVAGHPAKVPFETAKWVIDLVDQAFTAYLDRYGACAQAAAQKAVMEKLEAIERAVA